MYSVNHSHWSPLFVALISMSTTRTLVLVLISPSDDGDSTGHSPLCSGHTVYFVLPDELIFSYYLAQENSVAPHCLWEVEPPLAFKAPLESGSNLFSPGVSKIYFIVLISKFTPVHGALHGHIILSLKCSIFSFPIKSSNLFGRERVPSMPPTSALLKTWLNYFTSLTHSLVFRNLSVFCLHSWTISLMP